MTRIRIGMTLLFVLSLMLSTVGTALADVQFVGVTSGTPTGTPIGTIPQPPTLTPTPPNTATPSGGGGGGGGGGGAAATATSTSVGSWTTTATATPSTPTPTNTPVIIPKLPTTGDAGLPLLPVLLAGSALVLAGALVRNRRARV